MNFREDSRSELFPEREMEEGLLVVPREERERSCEEGGARWWRWVGDLKVEGKKLSHVAAPMVAVMLSQYLVVVASSMMVGQLGELALSSAAIATSLSNVTGFSFLLGMATGLETLCGQAYGAQQYQKLATHTYRAIFCLILVCFPISFIWASMGKLLFLIGQDPLISFEAGNYAFWMIPGLFAFAISQSLMKFLQSQSLILPMLFGTMTTLCLHIPLCWVLVFKSGLGSVGASLSISISYWFYVLILVVYIKYSASCEATRSPLTKEAFKGINEFLRLALPSATMICFEWWSFELLILFSGLLPNPKLETSVLSICLNTIALLYMIPYGISAAGSIRISNELGAGNPEGARLVACVVMLLAVSEATIVSGSLFGLRRIMGYAYSNEIEVVDYVTKMVPLVCVSAILDCLQGVISGIARGCGWQHLGAYVNLGSFYLLGIPMALVLGFLLHLKGMGLWMGIICGSTLQTTLLCIIAIFTNWEHQANMARERTHGEILK